MTSSSSASTRVQPGEFCWVEASVSDPAAAKAFYAKLFGWTYQDDGEGAMTYTHLLHRGVMFGGLHGMMPEQTAHGVPSHWMPYVKVANLAATVAKAERAGGTIVLECCEIPDSGKLAVFSDPSGATLAVWEPLGNEGAGASLDPGRPSWFELLSTDRAAALRFYSAVFGWTTSEMDMGEMGVYQLLHHGGPNPIGGSMQIGPEFGGMPSAWMLYFTVADCDQSAALAVKLGGKLCHGPMDVPGVGRFAVLSDLAGAMLSIIAYPART